MSAENDLALAYHMGYDDAIAKRRPDASKAQVLAPYDLAAENAKLRELVARVERARRDLCDAYPDAELLNCEECPAWSACRGDLMDHMREMRIEVDE